MVGVAALLSIPVLVVLGSVFVPAGATWAHLAATVLDDYVRSSVLLIVGVGIGAITVGVACAWLVSTCEFPGRRVLEWALLLPMAMPAYIVAYTYTGLLDFAGPVQSALRDLCGWRHGDYWFPAIRSLPGAIAMLVLVTYPYVYLLARAAFLQQSVAAIEAARTLGAGPWRGFATLALPMARPGIAAGAALAMMEALADYGTMQHFGVSTFTTGIFRTWYGLGDRWAAAQLAAALTTCVALLLVLERVTRGQARYHATGARTAPRRWPLSRGRAALALGACLLPLALGFLLPAGQLLYWARGSADAGLDAAFPGIVLNSLGLAAAAALLVLLLALLLGYGERLRPVAATRIAVRIAALGYAVPGAVIALGVMLAFASFDHALDAVARARFGMSTGLLLSGTLVALLFAYAARFLAVGTQAVGAGLARIRPSMDDAARSLGLAPREVLRRVHLPLVRASALSAAILVFVDVLKELPATLILRPFDFNTLAVRTYELASDERLADAAVPALAIVVAGLLPVVLLSRSIRPVGAPEEAP